MSEYYCQYCMRECNEWVCNSCGEYKGVVQVGPTQTNESE